MITRPRCCCSDSNTKLQRCMMDAFGTSEHAGQGYVPSSTTRRSSWSVRDTVLKGISREKISLAVTANEYWSTLYVPLPLFPLSASGAM